jgi:hypothetical protein
MSRSSLVLLLVLAAGCPIAKGKTDGGLPDCSSVGTCGSGICDHASGTCVSCRNTGDCLSDEVCRNGACTSTLACTGDSDCAGGHCDLVLRRCVDCTAASHCDGGACLGFTCTAVTGCTAAADCRAGLQVCGTADSLRFPAGVTQACQDCATASDCAPGLTCYQGVCGGDTCTHLSKCPSDPAGDIGGCEDHRRAAGAACHAESDLLSACVLNNQTCGTDGRTDLNATLGYCTTESSAYNACANPP